MSAVNAEKTAVHPWLLPAAAPCLIAGMLLGRVTETAWPGWVCLALALLCAGLIRRKCMLWPLLLTAAALGMVCGQTAWHPALPAEGEHLITGVVTDEVTQRDTQQIHTLLSSVTIDGTPVRGEAYWSFYQETIPEGLQPGVSVTLTARVYHPTGATNPGGYDFREYLLQQGVLFGIYGGQDSLTIVDGGFHLQGSLAALRHTLLLRLQAVMGEEAGGYAAAMLLGIKSLVPSDDREYFNALGIGHILSVSGFHVGVLAALLAALLRLLRVRLKYRWLPTGIVLFLYCVLTGGNAPVVRASVLYLFYQLGRRFGRPKLSLHLLSASACVQLLFNPTQLTGAGFQLSYGAMLGLMLLAPRLTRLAPWERLNGKRSRKWLKAVWGSLCGAVSAQAGILLPELYWYQVLPVLGILSNLLLLALAGYLLMAYWACLALMYVPGLGMAVGSAAAGATQLMLDAVRTLGSADWLLLWTSQADWLTAVGWGLLLLGGCSLWPRFRKRNACAVVVGLLLIVASVLPWPSDELTYTQLDVNAADAAVINDHGQITVIDTGEDSTLSAYLHQRRLSVDTLVLTHLHTDHAGGVAYLLDEHIPVRTCYIACDALEAAIDEGMETLLARLEASGTELVKVARGDVIPLTSGSLTVLWPEDGLARAWQDANDGSLVLYARLQNTSLLLTGDITSKYEHYSAVPADVLKVAHHGSFGSTDEAFLESVSPEVLLLSCGPESRTEAFAERAGDRTLYSTATQGAIQLRFT